VTTGDAADGTKATQWLNAGPPGDELILRTGTDKLIEQVLAPTSQWLNVRDLMAMKTSSLRIFDDDDLGS